MKFKDMKKGMKIKINGKIPIKVVKRVKEKVEYTSKSGKGILIRRPFDDDIYDFKDKKIKVLNLRKAKKLGGE